MIGDFLPPVVTELKADIGDFAAKIALAKRMMNDLGNTRRDTFAPMTRNADTALKKIVRDARKAGDDAGKEFGRGFFNQAKRMTDLFIKGFGKGGGRNQTGFFGNIMDFIQRLSSGLSAVTSQANTFGTALTAVVGVLGPLGLMGVLAGSAAILSSLVAGLTAGALGVGAFAAVAIPAFTDLKTALTTLSGAQTAYQQASNNLVISIHHSAQNLAQYKSVVAGLDPNLRSAAKLLLNQNVQWQHLTKSQRNNVVALSQNHDALKNMSPAMKSTLDALLQQKAAWDSLTPAQKKAAVAVQHFSTAWSKMTTKLEPIVLNVLTGFLKALQPLIPVIGRFARVAAGAFGSFAKELAKDVKSPAFKQFIAFLLKVSGPVISSLLHAFMNIMKALGGLMNAFGNAKDTTRMFGGTIRVVTDLITAIIIVITMLAKAALGFARIMINVSHWVANAWHFIQHAAQSAASFIKGIWNSLPSWAQNIGRMIIQGLINGLNSMIGNLGSVVQHIGGTILGGIGHLLGINSPSKVMHWHGQMAGLGFVNGLMSMVPHINRAAGAMSAAATPSGGFGGFGGSITTAPSGGSARGGGQMQPIVVNVDGRRLFQIMQSRTLGYNVANNRRTPSGSALGVMAT